MDKTNLIIRAVTKGKPQLVPVSHNGIHYNAIQVDNKMYIPDKFCKPQHLLWGTPLCCQTYTLTILAKAPEIISSAFCLIICFFRKPSRHFVKKSQICRCLLSDVSVHWTVGVASAVVLSFFVHAKGVPCRRAVNVLFVYVVHTHGDTQHTAHCN